MTYNDSYIHVYKINFSLRYSYNHKCVAPTFKIRTEYFKCDNSEPQD